MPGRSILPIPPQPLDNQAIPQAPYASTGARKRADTEGVFQGMSKLLHAAQDKHYQMKVQKLQKDYETLSGAMQGYNEAKASSNQEMMEHNANIINTIVSDPKKAKELSKAFDVNMNPMAQGKGKEKPNPAHDALKAAFTKDQQAFQKGETKLMPQAQAMMRQMPQTLQPDPRYQAYLQSLQTGASPKAGEMLTFAKDMINISERAAAHKMTSEDKLKLGELLAKSMTQRASIQQTSMLIRTMEQIKGAKERMEILTNSYKYRADKSLEGVQDRTKVMIDKLKDNKDSKDLVTALKGLQDTSKTINDEMKIAQKNHDAKKMKQLSQQADIIKLQIGLATAEAARRTGLDPEDFTQTNQPALTPEEQTFWGQLFSDSTEQGAEDTENPEQ
jgi:hypothetical protein